MTQIRLRRAHAGHAVPQPVISYRLGATVQTIGGPAGHLDRLAIDPDSRQITHLVVRLGWPLSAFGRLVVVPAARVRGVTSAGDVSLDLDEDELATLPGFAEREYAIADSSFQALDALQHEYVLQRAASGPAPSDLALMDSGIVPQRRRLGVPEDSVTLHRGDPVAYQDGVGGCIEQALADPRSGVVTHLVVRCGGVGPFLTREVMVPLGWLRTLDGEVVLDTTRAELEALPAFDSGVLDRALAAAVGAALASPRPGSLPAGAVRVQAQHGVVTLSGAVGTEAARIAFARAAAAVAGVREVRNQLVVASPSLASVVAAALARDPRTAGAQLDVEDGGGGTVSLTGNVADSLTRTAAEEVAGAVPGVSLVIDEIRIGTEDTPSPA